ncbi:MAG: glycosyltransferase [Planctomycetaceae bacterium]|jgi:glycosyltransferase involved in cell wall biosynthesis|nr:glycosyltransferase [Planctomycetaceae bacterium]
MTDTQNNAQKKIRVCFVSDFWRGRAGAELQLALLLRHIDKNRIEPFVLILHENENTITELPDCPVFFLKMGWLRSFSSIRKMRELCRFFRQNRIDILQALVLDNFLLAFVSLAARWCGIKKIFGFRVDIGFWMNPRQARMGKLTHRFFTDKVIANAEACKQSIIEQEHVKAENVIVIPNLIDMKCFRHIPVWNAADAGCPKRVGIVGNLKQVKGTDVFIDAAKIVLDERSGVQFELAGTGKKKIYQDQIERLGIAGNVRLLGSLTDIPAFLSALDVAVLSSRSEGLPNAVMEYMAAGRPIAVTDAGGCRELIRHEENGLLVPPENPQALAAAILDLLDHPDRAERFAKAARNDILGKYDADVLANTWLEVYERELGRGLIRK